MTLVSSNFAIRISNPDSIPPYTHPQGMSFKKKVNFLPPPPDHMEAVLSNRVQAVFEKKAITYLANVHDKARPDLRFVLDAAASAIQICRGRLGLDDGYDSSSHNQGRDAAADSGNNHQDLVTVADAMEAVRLADPDGNNQYESKFKAQSLEVQFILCIMAELVAAGSSNRFELWALVDQFYVCWLDTHDERMLRSDLHLLLSIAQGNKLFLLEGAGHVWDDSFVPSLTEHFDAGRKYTGEIIILCTDHVRIIRKNCQSMLFQSVRGDVEGLKRSYEALLQQDSHPSGQPRL